MYIMQLNYAFHYDTLHSDILSRISLCFARLTPCIMLRKHTFHYDTVYFDIRFRISLCSRNIRHDAQWTNFGIVMCNTGTEFITMQIFALFSVFHNISMISERSGKCESCYESSSRSRSRTCSKQCAF